MELEQQLINGLVLGCILALVAIGYALVFGILRVVNLAYGEIVAVGAFCGLAATHHFGPSLIAATGFAMLGAMIAGLLVHLLAVQPLGEFADRRSRSHLAALPTTLGAAIIIQSILTKLTEGSDKDFPQLISTKYIPVGPISISPVQLVIILVTAVLLALIWYLIYFTRHGYVIRACSENATAAQCLGVPVWRLQLLVVLLASAVAGVAGVLVSINNHTASATMGTDYGLKGLCAVIIAGSRSVGGAVIVALMIGIFEIAAVACSLATYRDAIAYGLLLIVLLVRPQGIFSISQSRHQD